MGRAKTVRCPGCGKRAPAPYSRSRLSPMKSVLSFRCGCGRRFNKFIASDTDTPPAGPRPPTP